MMLILSLQIYRSSKDAEDVAKDLAKKYNVRVEAFQCVSWC